MPVRNENRTDNRQRLKEIMEVMSRHDLAHGLTPEKLCAMIEDLGPTFIKLGQILSMRSDILPKDYCEALKKLRSSVSPMPYSQVAEIVERSYARPIGEVFASFDETALGSASIAQVHAAVLQNGDRVVVKVQREGIHEIMSRDIMLLKQACKLLKYTPVNELVDFNQVLDEMWLTAQEEMNFQTEAANLEKFRALNESVAFVTSPKLYREFTTTNVLVMERIDGLAIDDKSALAAEGYDLSEIGAKLADNYIRQIMTDGFFHADPHPGNLRVRDGKIVWLDMGMMGTLSDRERDLIGKAVTGIARNDINLVRDAVLGLGVFHGETDRRQLFRDIENLLDQYGSADLGSLDIAKVLEDMTAVMKRNGIQMPGSLTMLARGLATIEGLIADLSPEINIMSVVTARIGDTLLKDIDWKSELAQDARVVYESAHKSLEIPALLADILRTGLKGEANLGIEHHSGEDTARLMRELVWKLSAGVFSAALVIAAGLTCSRDLIWISLGCLVSGVGLMAYAFLERKKKKKKSERQ